MNTFKALGINDSLVDLLAHQGIKTPSPIQSMTIPTILDGTDVIAQAQTGTGKTLAFLLPIFQTINLDSREVQGLIVTPTRELALQITEEANKLAGDSEIGILCVYGGQDLKKQLKKLDKGIHLIIATPGRLLDHLHRETIVLDHLKALVLDEADQMLLIGFKQEVELILKRTNRNKQSMCFSATLDKHVKKLAYKFMNNPVEIQAQSENVTLDVIRQKVILATDRSKQEALIKELEATNPFLGIIFCRTKRRADKLEGDMTRLKMSVNKLHGDMSQSARQHVMKSFRDAKFQFLVTTDVAARGIDVTGITHIYNYDIPETPDSYIHRIGRTGRMGDDGAAITFISPKDKPLLVAIENAIGKKLPVTEHKSEHFDNVSDMKDKMHHVRVEKKHVPKKGHRSRR
ncbi:MULTISPECIES: DEAD/DEAH box helicase [unclassified Fusibacter]|uniref:DEAD/DEAH box helicase n=1 Tax=unclassified Fusibacter TaxID=2624464 RepID=UPI0010128DB9|nr:MULTISPECIES: DEAD/DEAH box helicase [unclassified Fusibacter]MCK8060134.1 DEAD/DEAH box helicase [Fusibacter sp. A2]NPE22276.1 DEAD/DEAH box helicase [Fusibacter sp. A1]RXV61049.1 ATP-dependent helicase [Fusibacter sp. A1]